MNIAKFKTFDNWIIAALFLFLPFNYALTIKLGFPLKISEIAAFILIAIIIISARFKIYVKDNTLIIITLFVVYALVTTYINLWWPYSYTLNQYESRFGYKFDSILKFFYLVLSYIVLLACANAYVKNRSKYNKWLIIGGLIAALYSWYLAIFSLLNLNPILLPGMDKNPQAIALSVGTIIRCGTFKEGNYMGIFLLTVAIIAMFENKKKQSYFLLATILTTFSSIAIFSAVVFFILITFKKYFTVKRIAILFFILFSTVITFLILLQNKDFRTITIDKFSSKGNFINNPAQLSKADRLNSIKTAFAIGMNNPVLGVGLSNYALHYERYNQSVFFTYKNNKVIPNNVYAEIFSETGFVGLLLFTMFLYSLYRKTAYDTSHILRNGFVALLIGLMAFPSVTVLFLWVFWGLIISLPKSLDHYEPVDS